MAGKVICYVQAGGFGTRLAPLLHQPGSGSKKVLANQGRGLTPWVHNSYYSVAKPVLQYYGVAMSDPLVRLVVGAGVTDLRMTVHNQAETVIGYYHEKQLGGKGVTVDRFLYENVPLDTSGGIVRDVIADMKEGRISPQDTILVVGGDIRVSEFSFEEFIAEHLAKQADITIALAKAPREEMYRFGAAVREGDKTEKLGIINYSIRGKATLFDVYGKLDLNPETMARINRFYEKAPLLDPKDVINPGNLQIQEILGQYGPGVFSPTTLQNGSIVAIRAELVEQLAPLVFNESLTASSGTWRLTEAIKDSGDGKFSDFGSDWFMVLTGSRGLPIPLSYSIHAEEQCRVIERLRAGLPQVFGYRMRGDWSDDGTLPSVLQAHIDILTDLVANGREAAWPINWENVRTDPRSGIISMTELSGVRKEISLTPPVFIDRHVTLRPGAVIGPYAVIGRGWDVYGRIEKSVLWGQKDIDQLLANDRGWNRFTIGRAVQIIGSLIGSGLEISALDEHGNTVNMGEIVDKVVVSNGSQNAVIPIDY